MSTLLAAFLTVTNGVAIVRTVTPGPGSFSVQCSADLHNWRVIESGYVTNACHIVARIPAGRCAFFRVEWR